MENIHAPLSRSSITICLPYGVIKVPAPTIGAIQLLAPAEYSSRAFTLLSYSCNIGFSLLIMVRIVSNVNTWAAACMEKRSVVVSRSPRQG
jgi:hypothetical protein